MKTVAALLAIAGAMIVGCEEKKTTPAPSTSTGLLDKAKTAGDKAAGAVNDAAKTAVDKTKEAGHVVGEKAKDAKEAVEHAADKAKESVTGAADALMTKAKDSGKAYLDQLTGATSKLTAIKTADEAKAAKPELETLASKFNGASDLVNKLPADMKSKVMDLMKGDLGPAVKGFKDQIARLTENKEMNAILGDTLKKFNLAS